MEEEKRDQQGYVGQLERENSRLKELVRELEEKRNSQEIIIDALVEQSKRLRKAFGTHSIEAGEIALSSPLAVHAVDDGYGHTGDAHLLSDSNKRVKRASIKEPENTTIGEVESLTRQVKGVFQQKQKNVDFKSNYSFQKFVEYAESTYEFSLMNKKVSRTKNPLKMFIEANLDKIIKYIVDNINQLNLNQVCSTFFLVNSEVEYKHKLVIMHDCILELTQYYKLPYIASALFNNHELKGDIFSEALKKILYHQCFVDREIFADEEVQDCLEIVRHNFGLERPAVSLWETPISMLDSMLMFDSVNGVIRVHNACIASGFTIRMVCHYLDWEYTYNNFIVERLYPKLKSDGAAVYAYYLGILAIDAYKSFGRHESISFIFQELLSIMGDSSDLSVVCFLVIKQFYEAEAECWLENNISSLQQRGFSRKFLVEFLLI